ncbi:MAG: hypothetical protein R3Y44_05530 [Rikenellaceae bacterium]
MSIITHFFYERLAELLIEQIDGREFYSDIINFDLSQVECQFSATLMIYYTNHRYPEGNVMQISNIVPVWWEFHTTTAEGEVLNDFDFELLKQIVCN